MDLVKDILTESNDLIISGGDFYIDLSDQQHIEFMLISQPGYWKESPIMGIGLQNYLKGPFDIDALNALRKKITTQLKLDGYENISIDIADINDININAQRAK